MNKSQNNRKQESLMMIFGESLNLISPRSNVDYSKTTPEQYQGTKNIHRQIMYSVPHATYVSVSLSNR